MKTANLLFLILVVIALFAFPRLEKQASLPVAAQTTAQPHANSALPAFLEKGKIYNFTFAVSQSVPQYVNQGVIAGTPEVSQGDNNISSISPVTMTGRIEKIDPQTSWLYINHVRPGKNVAWRSDGYSWINLNQVMQCAEIKNLP